MDNRGKKLLTDILDAGRSIRSWQEGHTFAEYEQNRLLRRAIEREFEIIGEALSRLVRLARGKCWGEPCDSHEIQSWRDGARVGGITHHRGAENTEIECPIRIIILEPLGQCGAAFSRAVLQK